MNEGSANSKSHITETPLRLTTKNQRHSLRETYGTVSFFCFGVSGIQTVITGGASLMHVRCRVTIY